MECRLEELRDKEVISITDGSRFGYVGDVVMDLDSGQIQALVVPGSLKLFGLLGRGEDTVFAWKKVHRFGNDTILVEGMPQQVKFQRKKRRWF